MACPGRRNLASVPPSCPRQGSVRPSHRYPKRASLLATLQDRRDGNGTFWRNSPVIITCIFAPAEPLRIRVSSQWRVHVQSTQDSSCTKSTLPRLRYPLAVNIKRQSRWPLSIRAQIFTQLGCPSSASAPMVVRPRFQLFTQRRETLDPSWRAVGRSAWMDPWPSFFDLLGGPRRAATVQRQAAPVRAELPRFRRLLSAGDRVAPSGMASRVLVLAPGLLPDVCHVKPGHRCADGRQPADVQHHGGALDAAPCSHCCSLPPSSPPDPISRKWSRWRRNLSRVEQVRCS